VTTDEVPSTPITAAAKKTSYGLSPVGSFPSLEPGPFPLRHGQEHRILRRQMFLMMKCFFRSNG
jgi:hypothetical protein